MGDNLKPQFTEDPIPVAFKYVDDITSRFHEYLKTYPDELGETPVALAVKHVEEDLLAYYSTSNGKRDIAKSPHHDKSPEEVVALLMQDVVMMGRAELAHRSLKRGSHGKTE